VVQRFIIALNKILYQRARSIVVWRPSQKELPTPSELTQNFFHRDKAFSHLSIRPNSYEIAKASGNSGQMPIIINRKYIGLLVGPHRFKQSRRKLFRRYDRNVNRIAQGGCSML
jgi:hypothetical protein